MSRYPSERTLRDGTRSEQRQEVAYKRELREKKVAIPKKGTVEGNYYAWNRNAHLQQRWARHYE